MKPAVWIWAIVLTCAMVTVAGTTAHADDDSGWLTSLQDDIHWSGYLRNETAFRYRTPHSFTKIRNILGGRANYRFGDRYELTAAGWAYYDIVYDLFDYRTISARPERDELQPLAFLENLNTEEDNRVLDVREFYLDIFFDNMDIRIGRQFVVWGVLTGVRIVDEVNPMDFRELILPDLLDYRIPLWMARIDYYSANSTWQLLWIPDLRFHKPAPEGSEWEMLQEVPGTTYPSRTIENSEIGIKVSRMLLGTEFSLSYFHTWDDFPVIFRRVQVDGEIGAPDPEFFPTYTRINMYGMTFERPFFGQVLKGEAAFVEDKYFGIADIDETGDGFLDNDGVIQRDHVRWGIGIDFNLLHTDFSLGLMQWVILDYRPEIIQERIDSSINLFIRREIPQRRAEFTMLGIFLLDLNEGYIKPKLSFSMSENFQIGVGMDIFWGEASQIGVGTVDGRPTEIFELVERYQFFGNFRNNDRIFLDFTYTF